MPGRIGFMLALVAALGSIAFAALGVHWGATVFALGTITVLAAIQPPVVVAMVVLSIPVQSALVLPFVRGVLTLTQLCLFGLIAGWGALFWRRKVWLDSIVVGFLLVLAAYAVSFIAVDSPSLWFQESYRWAAAGVFYVICRSVITTWNSVRLVLIAIAVGVASISMMGILEAVDALNPGRDRVSATFGTANPLAAYLEMTVPVLLACIPIAWWVGSRDRFSKYEKLLFALVPVGGLIVIGLTQSRGGLLGLMAACGVLWIQLPGKARLATALVSIVMIAGFLSTSVGQSQLNRFTRILDETTQATGTSYELDSGRDGMWAVARAMIADQPLTGIGAGEFDENHREYAQNWLDRHPRGQAHNVWLQMGAQAGVWGALGYAWWFAASVWSIITARRRVESRAHFWLITGVLAVFAAYAIHSLVDYLNVLSLGLQLSALTAIALNLAPEPLTRYIASHSQPATISSLETAPCPQ